MKRDIERLMAERDLGALIVTGKILGNPPMKYLVGDAGLTTAIIVKIRGGKTILVHGVMEREEARSTGFELMDFEVFGFTEIIRQGKSPMEAQKELLKRIIGRLGIRGKVGLYGRLEVSRYFALMQELSGELDGVEWRWEREEDLFSAARLTKDKDEIGAIRSVGERTSIVIDEVVQLLRSAKRSKGILIDPESKKPLKVRDVKRQIALSLAKQGLLEEEETIFSIGYDTAVPHNRGKVDDTIGVGQPIIFDIFPADPRSGYYYDVTRSMVVGDPPEEFLRLYEDVRCACETAAGLLAEGKSASGVNDAVIEYFQKKGHPTLQTKGNFTEGYCHGLGHGIGLDVHEQPALSLAPMPHDRFEKGMVFTVEPGLYYPGRSIGVRIEDVYFINEDGVGEKVVEIPEVYHID